jgi:hypothetical protein
MYSSNEYRYATLSKRAQRFEKERKQQNPAYAAALQHYLDAGGSLKTPGGGVAYSRVVYSNLSVLADEKLSDERRAFRFARTRARDRELSHVARDMGGANPDAAAKRLQDAGKRLKRGRPSISAERQANISKMKRFLDGSGEGRSWCRVIFFGDAQFGNGRYGPLPRKALLKKLGEIAVVVLTDEYLTSQQCVVCGCKLKQCRNSRTFQCKTTNDEGEACSVQGINRDVNAGGNMTVIGVMQLLGLPRPAKLTRPKKCRQSRS